MALQHSFAQMTCLNGLTLIDYAYAKSDFPTVKVILDDYKSNKMFV